MSKTDDRMKPIIVLPEGTMKAEDIAKLTDNGLCVVEAKNPALVKFVDPIPSAAQRTKVEDAAIQLSRKLLNGFGYNNGYISPAGVASLYVHLLVNGTPLDSKKTQSEIDQEVFDDEKHRELRRLAREDAKSERAAIKAAKEKEKKESQK